MNLADIPPNHPFAHDCIIIGSYHPSWSIQQQHQLPRGGSHGVNGCVSLGYERHDVHVSARKWNRILAGEPVMVKSVAEYEGKSFTCRWHFDLGAENTLVVSYGSEGADGYIGNIWDAGIEAVGK